MEARLASHSSSRLASRLPQVALKEVLQMYRNAVIGIAVLTLSTSPAFAQANKAATAARPGSDQAWVMNTAKGGMAEVELGKLAVDKASNADVKKFAQRMVDDHSKANDELKALAGTKGITLPAGPDAAQKATHDRLAKLSGPAFDRAYMQVMVQDHTKAVAGFKSESQAGKDADIKAFAAKTLPTVEDHLKMAKNTDNQVVSTSPARGKTTPKKS
jgi:putative membrane protein